MTTRRQLALLLFAAMACVATMLASFVAGHPIGPGPFDARHVLLIALVAGAGFIAALIVWHMNSVARRETHEAKAESLQLRRNLAATDAIIRAEPQVLIFWEQGQAVRIVSHTLTGIPGLPEHHAEILRFGQWLEASSAQALKSALEKLFGNGRSFSIILKTTRRRRNRGRRRHRRRARGSALERCRRLQAGDRQDRREARGVRSRHPLEPRASEHAADARLAARAGWPADLGQHRLRQRRRCQERA